MTEPKTKKPARTKKLTLEGVKAALVAAAKDTTMTLEELAQFEASLMDKLANQGRRGRKKKGEGGEPTKYKESINWMAKHDAHPPPCTNNTDYRIWRKSLGTTFGKTGFCVDCTPGYQREMIYAKRCQHPGVMFYIDRDGMIAGTHQEGPTTRSIVTFEDWEKMEDRKQLLNQRRA